MDISKRKEEIKSIIIETHNTLKKNNQISKDRTELLNYIYDICNSYSFKKSKSQNESKEVYEFIKRLNKQNGN